jgi:hypothetical protein
MGDQWHDWETNLLGFLQVIEKQGQWRQGRDDWRSVLAYYNNGSTTKAVGQRYADKVLAKAKEIERGLL